MRIPIKATSLGAVLFLTAVASALLAFGPFTVIAPAQTDDPVATGALPASESKTPDAIPKVTRKLPQPPPTEAATDSGEQPPKREITAEDLEGEERPTAESVVRNAFEPPPAARSLSKTSSLWIDPKLKRVYADGYVIMNRGLLEMFACPMNTKEHESVVAILAKSSQVHAALLAVGAMPGTPVRYSPAFLPATGQRIRVWVSWLDKDGKYQVADARTWIRQGDTTKTMEVDWVFAGSGFWKDDRDGKEHYQADSGDMICVSNFSTAMLDVPVESSAQADALIYSPFTERIPERGTPIRLTLVPIPVPSDPEPRDDPAAKQNVDAETPPSDEYLKKKVVDVEKPTTK
jgi:hypothetical protein